MCQPWQFEDSSFGKKRQLILSIYFVLTVTSSQWCPHNYPQSNISNSCLVSEFFHLQPLNYNNFIHGNKIGISKYNKLTGTFFHFKSPTTLVISGHHWTHTFTQRSLFFWPSLPPWHLIVIRDLPPKFNSLNSQLLSDLVPLILRHTRTNKHWGPWRFYIHSKRKLVHASITPPHAPTSGYPSCFNPFWPYSGLDPYPVYPPIL